MSDPPLPPPSLPLEPMAIDAANAKTNGGETSSAEALLSKSEYLTRCEVLRRRSERMKRLAGMYRSHYWVLMEELRAKYKEYYWTFGKSPYRDECNGDVNGDGDGAVKEEEGNCTNRREREKEGNGEDCTVKKCGVAGCKSRPMAMTRFCHSHILSDSKQKLYTGCTYVVKSGQAGPIFCGKPILKTTVPSLCSIHFQKAEKHVARALKKAGLNVTSPSKVAPKLHVVVAEYVRQIQTKRRAAKKASLTKVDIKEEKNS